MEYQLPALADMTKLQRFLSEYRDNGEHEVLLAQDVFERGYSAWLEQIEGNAHYGN